MNKKILIVSIMFLMIAGFFGCSKSETSTAKETEKSEISASTQEAKPTATAAIETTPTAETEPEEIKIYKDIEFILTLLGDGELIFMENTQDMNANKGGEFGDIGKKQMGDGGYEFTFEPNTNEHLPLVTHLDEFEGVASLSGQAVFIRFKTTTTGIYFSFLGDNDFGVYFGDEGAPLVFTYTENNPFSFEGDLKLEADKWYNMLMAMESDGTFNCLIYLDAESDNLTFANVDLGETSSGTGYKDQSWQFEIATHEEGAVTVERYDVYTYSEFTRE